MDVRSGVYGTSEVGFPPFRVRVHSRSIAPYYNEIKKCFPSVRVILKDIIASSDSGKDNFGPLCCKVRTVSAKSRARCFIEIT